MENNFSEELINEMSRDMCFQADSCTIKSCYRVNCETTWLAENLLRNGWQKPVKAEWTPIKQYSERWGVETINYYRCSNCGSLRYTHSDNYCSKCGAKMAKGENQ